MRDEKMKREKKNEEDELYVESNNKNKIDYLFYLFSLFFPLHFSHLLSFPPTTHGLFACTSE